MNHLGFAIQSFATLFAVTDPVGLIPVFIAITATMSVKQRKHTAIQTAIASLILLLAISLGGRYLLTYLDVSIAAFRVVGGILLGKMGFDMLHNVHSAVAHPSYSEQHDHLATTNVAFTPLAIPMIAGPATIASIMSLTGNAFEPARTTITIAAMVAAVFICFIVMYFCHWITKWFGPTRMGVATRLMGFLLLVMAAQMGLEGVRTIMLQ